MKKLLFVVGLVLSSTLNAQKIITLEFDFMFEFLCDSKENYKDGFKLTKTPSYNVDAIRIGSNKIIIDLVNKNMINDSDVDGIKLHEEYVLHNLNIKSDTISFSIDHKELHEGKYYELSSYISISLNTESDSDILIVNSWFREDLNRIEGLAIRKNACTVSIK
jgi:hypothetical protein